MTEQISTLLALALALAALVVGCGGGGDATLTKAEFIKKADAICEKADKTQLGEAGAYEKSHFNSFSTLTPTEGNNRLAIVIILPSVLKEAEEIEALGAPKGEQKKIDLFLAEIRKGVKAAEKNPLSLAAENALKPGYPLKSVKKFAHEYGFKECDELV